MSSSRITLESFEVEGAPKAPPSQEYLNGVEAGRAAVESETASLQKKALADIAATLSDMSFGYEEARDHLLTQIRPILAQISEVILPEIAKRSFSEHLQQVLFDAFEEAADGQIDIAVAPEVQAFLDTDSDRFKVVSDPELQVGQALLRESGTHIMIDLPALLDALQSALQGLEPPHRSQSNG